MLVKLPAEQIATNWEFIKQAVIHSSPLELRPSEDRLNNVLESLLIDEMQAWVYATQLNKPEEPAKYEIHAVVVTTVLSNAFVGINNLLMYSLWGNSSAFGLQHWKRGLLALAQYARKRKCQQIVAYTSNPQLVEIGKKLNANTDSQVVVFPLD